MPECGCRVVPFIPRPRQACCIAVSFFFFAFHKHRERREGKREAREEQLDGAHALPTLCVGVGVGVGGDACTFASTFDVHHHHCRTWSVAR